MAATTAKVPTVLSTYSNADEAGGTHVHFNVVSSHRPGFNDDPERQVRVTGS